jgi:hypothetical protein
LPSWPSSTTMSESGDVPGQSYRLRRPRR